MIRTIAATTCVVLSLLAYSVSAELLAEKYGELKGQSWFESYIDGIGEGYKWANAELAVRGQPPLYCPPPNLVLYTQNYLDLLDRYLAARLRDGGDPNTILLEQLLLQALQDAFPCKGKKESR
jgi:hypothetical protein